MSTITEYQERLGLVMNAASRLDELRSADEIDPGTPEAVKDALLFVRYLSEVLRSLKAATGDVSYALFSPGAEDEITTDRTARMYAAGCELRLLGMQMGGLREELESLRGDLNVLHRLDKAEA